MHERPGGPLTPEVAEARFTSARAAQRRIQESYASGARLLSRGLVLLAAFGGAAWAAPPAWWNVVALLGVVGGALAAFGVLRLAAAFALSRRASP